MADIKVGDVVELKSGGPDMTVNKLSRTEGIIDSADCSWFDPTDHKLKEGHFALDALKPVDESKD